jgi:hypothetical protein
VPVSADSKRVICTEMVQDSARFGTTHSKGVSLEEQRVPLQKKKAAVPAAVHVRLSNLDYSSLDTRCQEKKRFEEPSVRAQVAAARKAFAQSAQGQMLRR